MFLKIKIVIRTFKYHLWLWPYVAASQVDGKILKYVVRLQQHSLTQDKHTA